MSKSIKRKLATIMIVGILAVPNLSFANDKEMIEINEVVMADHQEESQNNYVRYEGTIQEIRNNNGQISILVVKEDDPYGLILHISDRVSLWNRQTEEPTDSGSLKEGTLIEAYYHKNTPMALSLPGQLTPRVIVVQDKDNHGPTYMGEFNNNLISTDNFLKLNIGEDTIIINNTGDQLTKEDIYNQTALVFYGASTKSIPAQTTPSKVIVFNEYDNLPEVESGNESEVTDETENGKETNVENTMIALRSKASELGYNVKWNENKSIELTKQNQTIVISIGKVDYSLNKSIRKFDKAPELKNGITYVSSEILEIMQ